MPPWGCQTACSHDLSRVHGRPTLSLTASSAASPQSANRRLSVESDDRNELVKDLRLLATTRLAVPRANHLDPLFHTRPRHRVPFPFGNPTYEESIPFSVTLSVRQRDLSLLSSKDEHEDVSRHATVPGGAKERKRSAFARLTSHAYSVSLWAWAIRFSSVIVTPGRRYCCGRDKLLNFS